MPEFVNPFSGQAAGRKLGLEELIRAIRLNIAAEHEAVHLYMAHAEATEHPLAREILMDIANEERVHIGEFQRLLEILSGDEEAWLAKGREEVDAMAAQHAAGEQGDPGEAGGDGSGETTIGSLKD